MIFFKAKLEQFMISVDIFIEVFYTFVAGNEGQRNHVEKDQSNHITKAEWPF